jgi:transposase
VVEEVEFGSEGEFVIAVRPVWRERDRCGICRRRCPGFDLGEGRRRWRTLDLGTTLAYLESESPRVRCRRHGVVVCAVPWARHGSRFTRSFEDQVAWLAVNCSKTAVSQLMRIAWRTVGGICARVAAEAVEGRDLLAGLTRIGIDEISHRKGQRYLTVVVDHDSGRLVWAAPGRDRKTVEAFLDKLGEDRCKQLELVSCDMAAWISGPVAERCPNAELCLDPFHVVQLATKALDEIRREVWNQARREGLTALAGELKDARFALWKNPENLTARQETKLARIEQTNRPIFRAYLLKEQLRQIYRLPAAEAAQLLERWLIWARRCRLRPFVKLAKTITQQKAGILAAITNGLSNARVEAINTQIRLITRRAFGFHTPEALIALAMLSLAGLCPPLPGR